MNNKGLLMLEICMLILALSGCMSQTQNEQPAASNDNRGAAAPQGRSPHQQGENMRMPLPPGMADACIGKIANETCVLKMNDTVINGTCRNIRTGNLTCFPSNMGQRGSYGNRSMQYNQTQRHRRNGTQGQQDSAANPYW